MLLLASMTLVFNNGVRCQVEHQPHLTDADAHGPFYGPFQDMRFTLYGQIYHFALKSIHLSAQFRKILFTIGKCDIGFRVKSQIEHQPHFKR